jgi:hypothetical protein
MSFSDQGVVLYNTRRFYLYRQEDISGISGLGIVADGVLFPNGLCVIAWRGKYHSIEVFPTVQQLEAVHGHGGKTHIVYEDLEETLRT